MNFADISHHQSDPINWRVYSATRDRVALKASQGRSFTDSKFTERWKNAKNGLVKYRLPYHYLEPDNRGSVDFDHFIKVVKSTGDFTSNDWLVLDTEKLDANDRVHPRARAATIEFVNSAVASGYTHGIVYSYRYYLDTANITANDLPPGWRMLWLADYTVGQRDSDIEVPPGWSRSQIIARQYTDKASVAGLTGLVDDSRVLNEWVKSPTPPSTKDWWDTVDQATAQATMEKAVKNVLNLRGDLKIPYGQLDNDNLAVNLTKGAQSTFNTLGDLQNTIEAVKADTALQGDDEAKILAALDEAETHVRQILGDSSATPDGP